MSDDEKQREWRYTLPTVELSICQLEGCGKELPFAGAYLLVSESPTVAITYTDGVMSYRLFNPSLPFCSREHRASWIAQHVPVIQDQLEVIREHSEQRRDAVRRCLQFSLDHDPDCPEDIVRALLQEGWLRV